MKRSMKSGGYSEAGLLLCVLFGSGCVADLGTMSRLQAAYGDQTSALMSPAVQGTMALGALSADACLATREGTWSDLSVGSDLPLSKDLSGVIGTPVVDSFSYLTTIKIGATPVRLAGIDDARLVLTVVTASPVLVTGKLTDASGQTTLADFAFEVVGDCTVDWARVSGDATWTLDGIDHSLTLPAESSGALGLDWPGAIPWLPGAGVLAWQGHVDGELRSFVSEDAGQIQVDGSAGAWPGTVSGLQWSASTTVDLQP